MLRFMDLDSRYEMLITRIVNRDVVHKFSVDLPKKHGRGGQSALRFARLREEKRHNYVRKVAELAVQNYISNDKVNVAGLIVRIGEALYSYSRMSPEELFLRHTIS